MKRNVFTVAVVVAMIAGNASAQGLSLHGDFSAGVWANSDGGAGLESNFGLAGTDTRVITNAKLSVANAFGNGFSGQVDLNFSILSGADSNLDTDDGTSQTADIALRGFREFGAVTGSVFLGYGIHGDYGDSFEHMGYKFAGIEVIKDVSFGQVYGQLGYLDSFDEYNEGTQDAPFIQIGATYALANDYTLSGALAYAGGDKYSADYENRILNAQIGIERKLANNPITLYANYEITQISYDDVGIQYGDTFQTLNIGVRFQTGSNARKAPRLPSFGKWVAYNANEVE